MHLKRWITGLVALPFLILLVAYASIPVFAGVLGLIAVLTLSEYFALVFPPEHSRRLLPLKLLAFVFAPVLLMAVAYGRGGMLAALLALSLVFSGLLIIVQYRDGSDVIRYLAAQVLGLVYIPGVLALLVVLRESPGGIRWLFLLLALVFAGDICALYVGSFWGRHKLCPAVSPKKTIEGSLGGLGGNLVVGLFARLLFFPELPWSGMLLMVLVAGMAGQIGDLLESVLKRTAHIKDSGVLLPGHGGLLDRIDALLLATPVVYLFRFYVF